MEEVDTVWYVGRLKFRPMPSFLKMVIGMLFLGGGRIIEVVLWSACPEPVWRERCVFLEYHAEMGSAFETHFGGDLFNRQGGE